MILAFAKYAIEKGDVNVQVKHFGKKKEDE